MSSRHIICGLLLICFIPLTVNAQPPRAFISGSMTEILSSQNRQPVIVSLWSIDCPPCYKELKLWHRLSRHYPSMRLVLISTDSLEASAEVQQVLEETGTNHLESWQFADPFAERLRYEVDSNWAGELPRTYFYAPNGESIALSGVVDDNKVEQWIAQFYPLMN